MTCRQPRSPARQPPDRPPDPTPAPPGSRPRTVPRSAARPAGRCRPGPARAVGGSPSTGRCTLAISPFYLIFIVFGSVPVLYSAVPVLPALGRPRGHAVRRAPAVPVPVGRPGLLAVDPQHPRHLGAVHRPDALPGAGARGAAELRAAASRASTGSPSSCRTSPRWSPSRSSSARSSATTSAWSTPSCKSVDVSAVPWLSNAVEDQGRHRRPDDLAVDRLQRDHLPGRPPDHPHASCTRRPGWTAPAPCRPSSASRSRCCGPSSCSPWSSPPSPACRASPNHRCCFGSERPPTRTPAVRARRV